ncbi:hypothetical protein MSG28_001639 [Choristoneura fumiferana]|uniref:Uncharacterized protein n=1 Tax=Choristoneura fumiferana TaxID=7141 RepID=A0ACC0KUV4_CHOFU|nr:hypothetical protein MSG28_001639 [Choristoneura fumiferana]
MESLDRVEETFAVVDRFDNDFFAEIEIRKPKIYRRDVDPLHDYTEEFFKMRFRFSKSTVMHVILPRVIDSLQSETQRGLPISPLCQLLTALRFYATGTFQIVHGDMMHISQSTVCYIVKRVSRALALLMPEFIKFPANLRKTKEEFEKLGCVGRAPGLKNIVGAIDCTHIKIKKPRGIVHTEQYRNRKDGGYPCTRYLLTPISNPTTPQEERYNRVQIKARNSVERLFGVWKRRFPCLQIGLATKLSTTANIIVACAVLHNIAVEVNDGFEDDDDTGF